MVSFLRVLHVEDNELDAMIYKAQLVGFDRCRFDVIRAVDLEEAFDTITKMQRFDIVLLDLNLPDSEGLHTLQAIIDKVETSTPITILSGIIEESVFNKALEMGAASFLVKSPDDHNVAEHLLKVFKKFQEDSKKRGKKRRGKA